MPAARFFRGLCLGAIVLVCAFAGAGRAQQITPIEVGFGGYAQSETNFVGTPAEASYGYVGPFARVTLNLNRSFALEASGFDSVNAVPTDNWVGGHQALALAGVKAGVRRRYLGVFGRLDAGVASFSRGDELFPAPPRYYRETHFALEPGASVEAYLGRRTILRADVDENVDAIFRQVTHYEGSSITRDGGGYVPHHLGAALSVERRFGALREAPALEPKGEHASVGGFFPLQIRAQGVNNDAPALGGGGAWVETPVWRALSADVLAFDLPEDSHTLGLQDGGTSLEFAAGPKVGFHLGRFGVFAKARPGFVRFSRTGFNVNVTQNFVVTTMNHPQYQFSLDTGAVLEYVPVRHLLLRFEGGDDLIFYHAHTEYFRFPREFESLSADAMHSSSMLFLAGVGWRF